jgi:hypothetical protein
MPAPSTPTTPTLVATINKNSNRSVATQTQNPQNVQRGTFTDADPSIKVNFRVMRRVELVHVPIQGANVRLRQPLTISVNNIHVDLCCQQYFYSFAVKHSMSAET